MLSFQHFPNLYCYTGTVGTILCSLFSFLEGVEMAQYSDKSRKNKKVVVIEKVRDKYGSVIALKRG